MPFTTIAFDADDTLWQNEALYQHAQQRFRQSLLPWQSSATIDAVLYEIEIRNLPIYGYGIKAFALSMIEAALQLTDGNVSEEVLSSILSETRAMLEAEVHLHPHVPETLSALSATHPLMLITMGDLLDQTAKIQRSGLGNFFTYIEIVNEKTTDVYLEILNRYKIEPARFLMIGNSLRSDIDPVLSIGGQAVHIPTESAWAHDHVSDFDSSQRGYYQLDSLIELVDLIHRIEPQQ